MATRGRKNNDEHENIVIVVCHSSTLLRSTHNRPSLNSGARARICVCLPMRWNSISLQRLSIDASEFLVHERFHALTMEMQ